MADDDRQLNDEQRTALTKFIRMGDRGRAGIFVGRNTELASIKGRIELLVERLCDGESAPGADLTMVIQGAPGAGKSALLQKIAEEWPLGAKDKPAAISVAASSLKLPMGSLLEIIARKAGKDNGIKRTLARFKSLTVNLAGMADFTVDMDASQLTGKSLTPVVLLIDEIQTILSGNVTDQARERITENIELLHTGEHDAPLFPIYGGLANSADLLRAAGLTRLASGSELTLPRFSAGEMDELLVRYVEQHLASAQPSKSTVNSWSVALRRDCQGWPMHCINFLISLSKEIKVNDWRPTAIDFDAVLNCARQLRFSYYAHRMQGILQNRYILISKVLEEMERVSSMQEDQLVFVIDQANQNRLPGDLGRSSLPEDLTAQQFFEEMLHAGLVQKINKDKLTCPIPSLASYVAAKATLPPSSLHEAVLDNNTADIDHALNLCGNDKERSELLQATDMRGRTPLALATELGISPLVQHLVELENQLPIALKTMNLNDNNGSERL